MDILSILRKYFGYNSFRPLQEEIINTAIEGNDVLVLMPTGGGKSICFQIPALYQKGLTVVISPLVALMKDQVDQLNSVGAPATYINSTLSEKEVRLRLSELYNGKFKLLYISPERLQLSGTEKLFSNIKIERFVVDEAHCISEWGHDFRPEYRQFSELRSNYENVPVMALTATATSRVKEDIVKQLDLRSPKVFTSSFNRSNLSYSVQPKKNPLQQILNVIDKNNGESGIIYCSTRAATEELADQLISKGVNAAAYHAGLPTNEKNKNHEAFVHDKIEVICATIAFGMGIDKSNVRFVIHHNLPKSLEGYYQETGRAGRDGLPGECLLLYSTKDKSTQHHFIDQISEEQEKSNALNLLRQITNYAESRHCRRKIILKYFGEIYEKDKCNNCDNCLIERKTYDGTDVALKLLACVYRIDEQNHKRGRELSFGFNHIIEILRGADNQKIKNFDHHKLSTFGIGKDLPKEKWRDIGNEIVQLGYLKQSSGIRPIIQLNEKGNEWLKSGNKREPLELTTALNFGKGEKIKNRSTRKSKEIYDEPLFEVLRETRLEVARERNVPPYFIFTDKTLKEMSISCPKNLEDFTKINGVGTKKLEDFGSIFIEVIIKYLKDNCHRIPSAHNDYE